MRLAFFLLVALPVLSPLRISAQQWLGIVAPSRAIDWSRTSGLPGGIPAREKVCFRFAPGARSSQINAAIANCPTGEVVFLSAGIYRISGMIDIPRSGVTLRGAGPDKTKLLFIKGGGCGNTIANICISGSGQWSGRPDNLTRWTAGYSQSAERITLDSVDNLTVGSVLILDQLDDNVDPGGVFVCGSTACSSEGASGGGGRDDKHSQMQFTEVKAINLATKEVTISPPLYMPNWRASQKPSAWWSNALAEDVGIEDLAIDNRTAKSGSSVVMVNAHRSWIRNVSSIGGGARSHIDIQYSARIVVRDSYFYGSAGANLSYGVETWMSGNSLVENNIFHHVTSPMLVGATSGAVYGYNYVTDQYSLNPNWLYPSVMEHHPGSNMNLVEGNQMPSAMEDAIHGTHNFGTFFRNHLSGRDLSGSQTSQTVPFLFQAYSRFANLVGNVLGSAGYHTTYQTNVGAASTSACNKSIYNLGWSNTSCKTARFPDDPVTVKTAMRWGNYDTANGTVRWETSEVPTGLNHYANEVPAKRDLPASFYLTSKPEWWNSSPWPPIGPDVGGGTGPGGHAYDIPAKACYATTPKDDDGIAIFNAQNCYTRKSPLGRSRPRK